MWTVIHGDATRWDRDLYANTMAEYHGPISNVDMNQGIELLRAWFDERCMQFMMACDWKQKNAPPTEYFAVTRKLNPASMFANDNVDISITIGACYIWAPMESFMDETVFDDRFLY